MDFHEASSAETSKPYMPELAFNCGPSTLLTESSVERCVWRRGWPASALRASATSLLGVPEMLRALRTQAPPRHPLPTNHRGGNHRLRSQFSIWQEARAYRRGKGPQELLPDLYSDLG